MSIETRLRNTGQPNGAGGGSSGADTGGLVNTGSAGYLAYYPSASASVSPSNISTSTGGGVASLNFQALTTQIVTPTTGDFWVLNSDGVSIFSMVGADSFSTQLYQNRPYYMLATANAGVKNQYVIQAGSSVTFNFTGTNLFISATTSAGASSGGRGFHNLLPQQAKLYPSNSAARIDAGTAWWRLLFSATTQQYGVWQFIVPPDYNSTPYVRIAWAMASSITAVQSCSWTVEQFGIPHNLAFTTPPYLYLDTFGAANTVTVGLSAGYSSGTVYLMTIPLANIVSLGAGNLSHIRISNTGNFVGDLILAGANFEYTR